MGVSPIASGNATIACAFVGLLDVEERVGDNPAFSPAATQFQECMIAAFGGTDLDVTHIYALRPVPSFPRHRRLAYRRRYASLVCDIPATLIGFVNFGPLKTITSGLTLFPRLLAWAWRERARPRVIMQYNLATPPAIVAVIAARMTGSHVIPIVADIQVPGSGLLPGTLTRRLEFGLQRRTLPLCDGLIVLTRRMVDDFAPRVAFVLMEGAVPAALLAPLPASRTPANGSVSAGQIFVLMYAGGLSALKGIPLLLSAFAMLKGDEYALWITGRGPLEGLVREAAAGDPRITYWGFPDQPELLRLYKRADALVNPHAATHESARYLFPSKLIEYLATGIPVVSTCSTPEVGEIYGHVAAVIPGDSAPDIAAQIRRLAGMTHTERRALGETGRSFALAEKTWERQARRISDFVMCIVNKRDVSADFMRGADR